MALSASVTVRDAAGAEHQLVHGDLIGRVWSAALCIDHPGVSEAHALVSLRGGALKLLALRGLFAAPDGKPRKELDLVPGLRLTLAKGVEVEVVEVVLPSHILELEVEGLGLHPLSGVCSLSTSPIPRLRPGARQGADAVFYLGSEGWRVRLAGGVEALVVGWEGTIGGVSVRVRERALGGEGHATRLGGGVAAPLRITTRYDSVLIERDGQPALRLTGNGARLISELAAVGAPLHWESLARELWPGPVDVLPLRRRFDANLLRLRRKIADAGIRSDLVRSDHSGLFELVLHGSDALIDENG